MATVAEEPRSPVLANLIVLAGFAVAFTTFVTDSPWSWIIGIGMVLAGALWAGFSDGGTAPDAVAAVEVGAPDAPEVATAEPAEGIEDGTEGHEAPHGPGTGEQAHGRAR